MYHMHIIIIYKMYFINVLCYIYMYTEEKQFIIYVVLISYCGQ